MTQVIPFSDFTASDIETTVRTVEDSIRSNRNLDEPVTPFATVRQLMGASPPGRWRILARNRWFERLHERLTREIASQVNFARLIEAMYSKAKGLQDLACVLKSHKKMTFE